MHNITRAGGEVGLSSEYPNLALMQSHILHFRLPSVIKMLHWLQYLPFCFIFQLVQTLGKTRCISSVAEDVNNWQLEQNLQSISRGSKNLPSAKYCMAFITTTHSVVCRRVAWILPWRLWEMHNIGLYHTLNCNEICIVTGSHDDLHAR